MFLMYDSTTLDQVPAGPHAIAAYVNGRYENYGEAKRRFPHTRLLGISVEGNVPAECYDIEQGNYTPSETKVLYQTARAAGIWRPCFYASLSTMRNVIDHLKTVEPNRVGYRLWVAYWNGHPDLPTAYDAHQFTDRALGRNLDESICHDNFFQPAKPAPDPDPASHLYMIDKDLGDSFSFAARRVKRAA